jgi:haloacetate dehalogenase
MFEGFARKRIKSSGAEIALVQGGAGSPMLLLHGYPQNHVIWHKVAPRLAQEFTLVIPDLRGYGDSSKPPTDADHLPYSKRAMALDMVEVMSTLGFDRFDIVGHDRGGRVTYRLAFDHPERVRRAAVLDIIPTIEQFERADRYAARVFYHWYFLAQPAPFPETLIGKDPDYFFEHLMQSLRGSDNFSPEAMEAYRKSFRDPEVIHASCEDYRAGITCDCKFDEADRAAGHKLTMPLLALWGAHGRRGASLLDIWKSWAIDVRGEGLDCGHFIPEEAPDSLTQHLLGFFGKDSVS